MPEFQAILFDFDGVLLDSEPVHAACWAEALAPLGISFDWDYYRTHFIGVEDAEVLRALAALQNPPLDFETLWACYPRKQELYRRRTESDPPFPKELAALLEDLATQYPLAVVSSSFRAEVEPLLVSGGLRQCFQALVCGEDVVHHKPAPDPYLLAARLLGVETALVVEDSQAGIASGRAAGFEVLPVPDPVSMLRLVSQRVSGDAARG
ncbi:MAG TPA: HAD family phosphatase [Bryobacteraceae bacterium]|nr:HAD family phosphatase [Bryobacteraceae bacterium]